MANLASSAVTVNLAWYTGGLANKDYVSKQVSLVLTGQGGTVNQITAAVLGFAKIISAETFITSTNSTMITASPSADGSFLVLNDGTAASAVGVPEDLTGMTVIGVVTGVPLAQY